MTTADMTEGWTPRLHELAAEEGVQGAALGVWADGQEVAADGQDVAAAAHGVLNAGTGVRTTADSLFQIGSITNPDLEGHAGRYERTSWWYDVSMRNGRLHVVSGASDDRAAFSDEGPHEFDLHPADGTGDNFVCRSDDRQPWSPLVFGRFGDQAPYLFLGGRITPRVG